LDAIDPPNRAHCRECVSRAPGDALRTVYDAPEPFGLHAANRHRVATKA
jgi:hypothetical protein